MTRKTKNRLMAIEEASKDGQGDILFVTHEADGHFRDNVTGRTYSAKRLSELHDTRPDLVIINQGGPGSPALPVHPGANPLGRTLEDVRTHNEIVGRRHDGATLTAEEEAFLADWEAGEARVREAFDAWEAESQPQFDETCRRVARLDTQAQARRKR